MSCMKANSDFWSGVKSYQLIFLIIYVTLNLNHSQWLFKHFQAIRVLQTNMLRQDNLCEPLVLIFALQLISDESVRPKGQGVQDRRRQLARQLHAARLQIRKQSSIPFKSISITGRPFLPSGLTQHTLHFSTFCNSNGLSDHFSSKISLVQRSLAFSKSLVQDQVNAALSNLINYSNFFR